MARFFRDHDAGEEHRATWLELFFDLVFVFAITQLSHLLLDHLTWSGLGETVFLLLAIWWAWGYTTWMTNWFDPDDLTVRAVLIVVSLASLFMAIAIPEAFGDRALMFALAYTGLQLIRTGFAAYALADRPQADTFRRIVVWQAAFGVLWVAGAVADDGARVALWLVALAADLSGPALRYWLPGRGRADPRNWQVHAPLFAERFQLFIIIVLGESIVVSGATASGLEITGERAAAIAVAFLGSAALWWLYFNYIPRIAPARLALAEGEARGRLARDAYTYLHLPMVAGILVAAVGDELVIAHPDEHLSAAELATVAGGPALYLLGHVGLRLRMAHSLNVRRLGVALAIVVVGAVGGTMPAVLTAALIVVVLLALIASETITAHRRRLRGEPTPVERLEREVTAEAP